MRAKFVNEKFIDDSDPIKDMGIGTYRVNFQEVYDDINPKIHLTNWLKYLESLVGKHINGKFKNKRSKQIGQETISSEEFLIMVCNSLNSGDEIYFTDNKGKTYFVIKSEDYQLSR